MSSIPVGRTFFFVKRRAIPHKKRFKKEKIRDPDKNALARGVALLGVKVTGIEAPRLTFVTVYRLPIRLQAKSALTWPVVQLVAYKPSHFLFFHKESAYDRNQTHD